MMSSATTPGVGDVAIGTGLVTQMTLSALLSLDDVAPSVGLPLNRKNVAGVLRRVLDGDDALDSPESVVKLCAILEPLLCGDDSSMTYEVLEKEQTSVASLAHLCRSESTDDVFRVLGTLRRALGKGGSRRTAYTLPALAYRGLELARVAKGPEFSARKVFQFVHETATALAGVAPARALRVFLAAALEADAQSLGAISYEFVSQAFILYEDELPDSKAQVKALRSMVGTLLAAENCDAPTTTAAAKAAVRGEVLEAGPVPHGRGMLASVLASQRAEAVEAPPPALPPRTTSGDGAAARAEKGGPARPQARPRVPPAVAQDGRRLHDERAAAHFFVRGDPRSLFSSLRGGQPIDHAQVHRRPRRINHGARRDDGGRRGAGGRRAALREHARAHQGAGGHRAGLRVGT